MADKEDRSTLRIIWSALRWEAGRRVGQSIHGGYIYGAKAIRKDGQALLSESDFPLSIETAQSARFEDSFTC